MKQKQRKVVNRAYVEDPRVFEREIFGVIKHVAVEKARVVRVVSSDALLSAVFVFSGWMYCLSAFDFGGSDFWAER